MTIQFCCLSRKIFRVSLGIISIELKSRLKQICFQKDFRKVVNDVFKTKNIHAETITARDADYVISVSRYLPRISLLNSHTRDSIEKIKKVMDEISKNMR